MSDSLKDQLLALGLAKEKPRAKKTGKPRKAHSNKAAANARKARPSVKGDISLDEAFRRKRQAEQQQVAKARQQKLEQDRRRREINMAIQEIVNAHKLNDPTAEIKRNFMYKGRIRSVLVTAAQLQQLNGGDVGLVFLKGSYYLLEPDKVQAVQALSTDHVPQLQTDMNNDDEEHPVPDDLVW